MWLLIYYNTFQRENKEQKSARSSFFGRFLGLKKLSGSLKFMRNRVSISDVCGKILFFLKLRVTGSGEEFVLSFAKVGRMKIHLASHRI